MPDEDPTVTPGEGSGSENTGTEGSGTEGSGSTELDCGDSSASTFLEQMRAAKTARQQAGLSSGPSYQGSKPKPIVWFDQLFETGAEPSGSVACSTPLRVGATQNQLDIVIVASHGNTGALSVPAGATIAAALYQSDSADGEFEACGPVITATVPEGGFSVDPDGLVIRIPVGNMTKAWLKPTITFTGVILGGTVDIALSFMPR